MDKAKANQLLTSIMKIAPDYNPWLLMGQALEETGFKDQSIIGWNNFWGIKMPRAEHRLAMIDRPVKCPTREEFDLSPAEQQAMAGFMTENWPDLIAITFDAKRLIQIVRVFQIFADWSREDKAVAYRILMDQELYQEAWKHRGAKTEAEVLAYYEGLVTVRRWCTKKGYPGRCHAAYLSIRKQMGES